MNRGRKQQIFVVLMIVVFAFVMMPPVAFIAVEAMLWMLHAVAWGVHFIAGGSGVAALFAIALASPLITLGFSSRPTTASAPC